MKLEPRVEGYWATHPDPIQDEYKGKYPFPIANAEPWLGQKEFITKLKKIEDYCKSRDWMRLYWGNSQSRLDATMLGSIEFTWQSAWRWPCDLRSHYIERFNVKVSDAFYEWVTNLQIPREEQAEDDALTLIEMTTEEKNHITGRGYGPLVRWGVAFKDESTNQQDLEFWNNLEKVRQFSEQTSSKQK